MEGKREQQLLRRRLEKLERARNIQERINDRLQALLTSLNRQYEDSLEVIAAQNRQLRDLNQRLTHSLQTQDRINLQLMQEVEERKRTELELTRAKQAAENGERAKAEFLAVMSHEIRIPLHSLLHLAELLLAETDDPRQRERLALVTTSGEHLTRVVDDILDISSLEAGRLRLNLEAFDLHGLLRDTLESFRPRSEAKGLTLSMHLAPDLPQSVEGDAARLRQTLSNLLSNAIKFTSSGEVCLQARPDSGERCRFLVRDTGIGIHKLRHQKIFRQFVQADTDTGARYGGSGLGLSIAQRLAELMGGDVGVESTPGKGSTFILHAHLPPAELPCKAPEPGSTRAVGSILMIEDHALNAEVTRTTLEHAGYTVHWARTAQQALRRLTAGNVDLLLLDVELPDMNGMELTRRMRLGEMGPDPQGIPVVGFTGHADRDTSRRCREAGMDDVLVKPVRGSELLRRLEKALAGRYHAGRKTPAPAPLFAEFMDKGWPQRLESDLLQRLKRLETVVGQHHAQEAAEEAHGLKTTLVLAGAQELARRTGLLEGKLRERQCSSSDTQRLGKDIRHFCERLRGHDEVSSSGSGS